MPVQRSVRIIGTLALAAVLWNSALAQAQEFSDLRGTAFIASKTVIDPPPNEPKNTHAYLQLSGPAALQMYRNMRAKEERNDCETGKKLKRAGLLMCSLAADGRDASCDFSINLLTGRLENGQAC
jgi:hypothetical protein